MAQLFQRPGSPYWYAWLIDPRDPRGRVRRGTGVRNKAQARVIARQMQAQLDAEIDAQLDAEENACGMTWLDAVQMFLKEGDVKKSTRAGYANIAKVVANTIGDFDLGQLSHEKIREFCQLRRQQTVQPYRARDTGRRVTDQTIRNNLSMMSSVYQFVIDLDLPNSPKVNPFKTFDRGFLKASKQIDRHLRPNQFQEILEAFKAPKHKAMLLVLVGTGMRSSELLSLYWEEVDFQNNLIEFGNIDPDRTKASRSRVIPLLEPVKEALITHRKALQKAGHYDPHGLVFPSFTKNEAGELVMRRRYDLKYLIKVVRKRTRVKGYVNHGLRHSFASWALQRGVDAEAIRRALGHTTLSTTQRYAHHVTDSMMGQFRERMRLPSITQSVTQTFGFVGDGPQEKEESKNNSDS